MLQLEEVLRGFGRAAHPLLRRESEVMAEELDVDWRSSTSTSGGLSGSTT